MLRTCERFPGRALFLPQRVVGVATRLDESQKLLIGDEVATGLERCHRGTVPAKLVVPAVNPRIVELAPQAHVCRRNGDQRIRRRHARRPTGRPRRMRLHVAQLMLADEHRRGLQVDALVLDAHHDDPPRVIPADRQLQRQRLYQPADRRTHLLAVVLHRGDAGPVVARVVEIVPAHFVDADGEHRLERRIDAPFDQTGEQQLVDEEGGGMAEIEDQRMTQRNGLFDIGLVAGQHLEELFVMIESCLEVTKDFGSLLLAVIASEQRCSLKNGIVHTDSGRVHGCVAYPSGQAVDLQQPAGRLLSRVCRVCVQWNGDSLEPSGLKPRVTRTRFSGGLPRRWRSAQLLQQC